LAGKDIKNLESELRELKDKCRILEKDNNILQKDYYNLIVVNEFSKLDRYVDNIDDLLENLFKTLEEIVDVDIISLSLLGNKTTYNALFKSVDKDKLKKLGQKHLELLKEHTEVDGTYIQKNFTISEKKLSCSKKPIFSNITHKIMRHGKLLGLVSFYFCDSSNIKQKNKIIKLIIPSLGTLIENGILFDDLKEKSIELESKLSAFETLYELTRVQSSPKKIDGILRKIMKAVVDEFYGVGGSLLFIDNEKKELYVKTYIGLAKGVARKFKMPLGKGIVGKIAVEGKALLIIDKKHSTGNEYIEGANIIYWDFQKEYADIRKDVISAISAPVKIQDEIIGVISISSDKHVFNAEDLRLLEVFSTHIAYIAKNSNLYNNLEKRLDELEIVNQLMKEVTVNTNLDDIIKLVFRVISTRFSFKLSAIMLDNFPNLKIHYYSDYNISDKRLDKIEKELLSDIKDMLHQPLYSYNINRTNIEKGNKRFSLGKEFDFITVPIVVKNNILGFIAVIHKKTLGFKEKVRFLSTIASAFAIALENNQMYKQLARKVNSLSTVFDVTRDIGEKLDYNAAAHALTLNALKILEARFVVLRMFDEEKSKLVVERIESKNKEFTCTEELLDSIELPFSREAFMKKQASFIDKLVEKIRIKNIDFLIKNNVKGIFCIPLIIRGKAIGVLNCYIDKHYSQKDDELGLLENLCSQVSIALENSRLFQNLEKTYFDTIAALAASIDAKDHYTHGHSEKVMEYSVAIAEELELGEEQITAIKFAGLLHDIGKIGVDDSILKKPGSLTDTEREEIEMHPVYGTRIVEKVEFLRKIGTLTYHHHERFDGTGYPDGLKGEQIPIGARILSVADTFDAMTSSRSYRKALPYETAIQEIKRCSGSQFDPKIVKAFLTVVGRKLRIDKMKLLRADKLSSMRKK